jgi:hypothetical protein
MRKCKPKKAVIAGTTNKQPVWYKRLLPNRKTRHKWVKQFLQSVKVEISFGELFKWIFFTVVWITFFPGSIETLALLVKLVLPLV